MIVLIVDLLFEALEKYRDLVDDVIKVGRRIEAEVTNFLVGEWSR